MDEDDFYDPGEEEGGEWFYVEEEVFLADELAETQIADPGYEGTNFEIECERYEFDLYEYWEDIEYGIDTYWDGPIDSVVAIANSRDQTQGQKQGQGQKRKRVVTKQTQQEAVIKRRKAGKVDKDALSAGAGGAGENTVLFMSLEERFRRFKEPAPALGIRDIPRALFPDWRERFGDDTAQQMEQTPRKKSMPAEMRKAAEAREEDALDANDEDNDDELGAEEYDLQNHDDEEYDDEDAEESLELSSLNPDTLKTILRQRLGDAGLSDMDEYAFMQTISKMLSGDSNADDATEELANSLLGQGAGGGDSAALSGWLARQGVSLEAAGEEGVGEEGEDDDDDGGDGGDREGAAVAQTTPASSAKTAPTAAMTHGSRRAGHAQVSPPDSAIGVSPNNDVSRASSAPNSRKRAAADTSSTARTSAASKRHKSNTVQQQEETVGPSPSSRTALSTAAAADPASSSSKTTTADTSARKRKADAEDDDDPASEAADGSGGGEGGGTVLTAAAKRPTRKKRTRG